MRTTVLIEDDEDSRIVCGTYLRHLGFAVLEAADGETGPALVRARRPDLVLLDIALPCLDGYELTRRLKADPATNSIPIVALTAHAHAGDRARVIDASCDVHLAKPLALRTLHVEVHRILRTG